MQAEFEFGGETGFLEGDNPAQAVMTDISNKAKRLMELKWAMEEAEQAYEDAKRQYDEYRCVTLPNLMKMAGIGAVRLDNGAMVEVTTKYYCKPNKNPEDMRVITQFLETHGMDSVIKKSIVVPPVYLPKLQETGIDYEEKSEINTNSLKAMLKDAVGANGGTPIISEEEIPKCIHFVHVDECDIQV